MKIVIIGVGAFGFAVINHLSKNNPNTQFFAYEKDEFVQKNLKETRENPYFFSGTKLKENVIFLDNLENIDEFDVIIVAIPAQFVGNFVKNIKNNLKPGVTFLNLSKGINNETLQTPSDILKKELWEFDYHYAILSGGMIAGELVEEKKLGAQIGCQNLEKARELQIFFENNNLKISLSQNIKNIELFGSLKNIFALQMGYLEGSGLGMSSIGYYFCELYKELPVLLEDLGGDSNIAFEDFSLGGDLIATCFGNSRNRYFGNLVGKGKSSCEAEKILKEEKKHAEGYYTLLGIQDIILRNEQLVEFGKIVHIFLEKK